MTARVLLLMGAIAFAAAGCAGKTKRAPMGESRTPPAASAPNVEATPGHPHDEAGTRPGSQADLAATAGDRVFFALDSHELSPEARDVLDRQAGWLARHPSSVLVAGHADERGTREYNLALGARRASAVRAHLVARGVSPGRIETLSFGKERPLDPRSNAAGWAANRNAQTTVRD